MLQRNKNFFCNNSVLRPAVVAERSITVVLQIQVARMPLRPRFESRLGRIYVADDLADCGSKLKDMYILNKVVNRTSWSIDLLSVKRKKWKDHS